MIPTDTPDTLQLLIEYDPQSPLESGSPEKAAPGTLRLALRALLGDRPVQMAAHRSVCLVAGRATGLAARMGPRYAR